MSAFIAWAAKHDVNVRSREAMDFHLDLGVVEYLRRKRREWFELGNSVDLTEEQHRMATSYLGDWMVLADDRILEYIREEASGRPKAMADSGYVKYFRQYISRRCKTLVEHELLDHLGNGLYVITDRGKAYLDSAIDTGEDRPDEPNSLDTESKPNGAESDEAR